MAGACRGSRRRINSGTTPGPLRRGVEELSAGQYIARFTTVLSNRFDTTCFKREHAEMYKQYTKQTTSRRFSVA